MPILRDIRAQLIQVNPGQQVMRVRDLQAWITGQTEYTQQRLIATQSLPWPSRPSGFTASYPRAWLTRTNELGVRMALGAKSADVFRIVMFSTAGNVGGGLAVGLLLSIAFDKLATKWVMETSGDSLILAGVTLLLLVAAALACFVPARRGASVGPMEALRYE
jgi:hypothetical protein